MEKQDKFTVASPILFSLFATLLCITLMVESFRTPAREPFNVFGEYDENCPDTQNCYYRKTSDGTIIYKRDESGFSFTPQKCKDPRLSKDEFCDGEFFFKIDDDHFFSLQLHSAIGKVVRTSLLLNLRHDSSVYPTIKQSILHNGHVVTIFQSNRNPQLPEDCQRNASQCYDLYLRGTVATENLRIKQ